MINRLHALFHRPEKGWDPISPAYAAHNSEIEWNQGVNASLLDELERWVGGFAGRRVLDLGGGPGHYSMAFAKRNAHVTWHDISRAYRDIVQRKATEENLNIAFCIGYMDAAAQMHRQPFDLVFSRICWRYSFADQRFADMIFNLVKPGGVGYIDTEHSRYTDSSSPITVRTWFNDHLAIKIGHTPPPHGRIAKLFVKKPIAKMLVDYSSPSNDRVLFLKTKANGDPK